MGIFINKIARKYLKGKYPFCSFNQKIIAHCFQEEIPDWFFGLFSLIVKCIDEESLIPFTEVILDTKKNYIIKKSVEDFVF